MRKNILVITAVSLLFLLSIMGCGRSNVNKESYKAEGEIVSIEPSNGVIEGVRSISIVTLGSLQSGSLPDPKDQSTLVVSITKDTKFFIARNGKKAPAAKEDIHSGDRAEIIWSFANDHLTVINEITIIN